VSSNIDKIKVTLDGIRIETPDYLPVDSIRVKTNIKGKSVNILYNKKGLEERKYYVCGKEECSETDILSGYKTIFIKNTDIIEKMVIKVLD